MPFTYFHLEPVSRLKAHYLEPTLACVWVDHMNSRAQLSNFQLHMAGSFSLKRGNAGKSISGCPRTVGRTAPNSAFPAPSFLGIELHR